MDVELSLNGPVATLRLNRPDKLNALTPEMLVLMIEHLERIEREPEIRAVILTGAGRAFCSGADIRGSGAAPLPPSASAVTNTRALGDLLYTRYIIAFQLAGLVLLVAMIGAIVLTLRQRVGVRRQSIPQQLARTRAEAVALVKVPLGGGAGSAGE